MDDDLRACTDYPIDYDRDGYRDELDEADQDYADRYLNAWDLLERCGAVRHPDDDNLTLAELEHIAAYMPKEGS